MGLINALTILLSYQLLGEISVRYFSFPIPGPVLGMLLLFATLVIRNRAIDGLEKTASGLLGHLSLLFVPAGVGIMTHFDRIADEWDAIGVALIFSTMITLAGSAGIMSIAVRLLAETRKNQDKADG